MDHEIRITTANPDLSGVQALNKALQQTRDLTLDIAKSGGMPLPLPGSNQMPQQMAVSQGSAQAAQQRMAVAENNARQLMTGTGGGQGGRGASADDIASTIETILVTKGAPIRAAEQAGGWTTNVSSGVGGQRQRMMPAPNTIPTPNSIARQYKGTGQSSPNYYKDWFLAAGSNLTGAAKDEWNGANEAWLGGEETAPQEFYTRHAADANMVAIPGATPGKSNVTPISPFIRGLQSSRPGSSSIGNSWSAEGIAGAAGGLLSSILPIAGPLALGAAAIGLGTSSFDQYMKSGDALSDLTKKIITVGDSLDDFQTKAVAAGQVFGYSAEQVSQIFTNLGSNLGYMGTTGLLEAGTSAMNFSRAYGVPVNSVASYVSQTGTLGMTMGKGSQYSIQGLLNETGAIADYAGMQGRTEQLMDEVTQVAQTVANTAVIIPNQVGMLAGIAALSQTGIRGLQGTAGGSILSTASQGVTNPSGPLGNYAELSAFDQAGFKGNYLEMKMQADQGAFGVLPNGEMNITAIMDYYKKQFPGADFNAPVGSQAHQQAAAMATMLGQMNLGLNPLQTQQLVQTALSDPSQMAALVAQIKGTEGVTAPPNLTQPEQIGTMTASIGQATISIGQQLGDIATGKAFHLPSFSPNSGPWWDPFTPPVGASNTTGLAPEGQYTNDFVAASKATGIPNVVLQAIATQESGMNQGVVSPAGAVGLMQLMPTTASDLGVDPTNPASNVMGGAYLLNQDLNEFKGDWAKALMAYSEGAGNVKAGRDLNVGTADSPILASQYAARIEAMIDKFSKAVDKHSQAADKAAQASNPLVGVNTGQNGVFAYG